MKHRLLDHEPDWMEVKNYGDAVIGRHCASCDCVQGKIECEHCKEAFYSAGSVFCGPECQKEAKKESAVLVSK